MGHPQRKATLTAAEYLVIERAAAFRSEFFAGEMFAMAGGTLDHSVIKAKLVSEICNLTNGRPCKVCDSDMRVKVEATGLYTYPDASVVCGAVEYEDPKTRDVLLNPILIAEVLSESSEAYDRGKKFDHYRQIASLKEYLIVSQESPTIERYVRNADKTWTLTVKSGLAESLDLASIPGVLSLAEVYRKVTFPVAETR